MQDPNPYHIDAMGNDDDHRLGIINWRDLEPDRWDQITFLQVLWMDSTMLGAAFIAHQLLWILEVFFKMDTGLWFDATKTIFIASLGFVTLTWRTLIVDTLE